jgi:hypothetical protein
MLWWSENLKDGRRADKLPPTLLLADDNGKGAGSRHGFEWVLSDTEG